LRARVELQLSWLDVRVRARAEESGVLHDLLMPIVDAGVRVIECARAIETRRGTSNVTADADEQRRQHYSLPAASRNVQRLRALVRSLLALGLRDNADNDRYNC
jgi:hypothetical protein